MVRGRSLGGDLFLCDSPLAFAACIRVHIEGRRHLLPCLNPNSSGPHRKKEFPRMFQKRNKLVMEIESSRCLIDRFGNDTNRGHLSTAPPAAIKSIKSIIKFQAFGRGIRGLPRAGPRAWPELRDTWVTFGRHRRAVRPLQLRTPIVCNSRRSGPSDPPSQTEPPRSASHPGSLDSEGNRPFPRHHMKKKPARDRREVRSDAARRSPACAALVAAGRGT